MALLGVLALGGCFSSRELALDDFEEPAPEQDAGMADASKRDLPRAPTDGLDLTVTGVQPSGGPFAGGNQAIVRGSGFTEDAIVTVGGRRVQLPQTVLLDPSSLRITLPAGEPGPADVQVEVDGQSAVLRDGYVYSALLIEPMQGSVAGGTLLTITVDGPELGEAPKVTVGGDKCTNVELVTPHQLRCKTPRGSVGLVDVVLTLRDADVEPLLAKDAFEYLDLTDTSRGGLGGGPIEGALNVTVIDDGSERFLPGAFVMVGDDVSTTYQGVTNDRGQITFSGPDLHGPISVHVALECFERTSIVAFDASNVTIFLEPLLDPTCGEPGTPSGGGRPAAGATITGELIFPGSDEFAINAWDVVPPPREDEVRVSYVFTTRSRIELANPSPDLAGGTARIEEANAVTGVRGYPYDIFARPAGLAVYALSGLERTSTREFVPYVMGIARDVLTSPGMETSGVDIEMNITLDRELQVRLANVPKATPNGPDEFKVQAHIDLGGEGVIYRPSTGLDVDVQTSFSADTLFRLFAQPALVGTLSDGRYQVTAGWYSIQGDNTPPYTEVKLRGVTQGPDPVVVDDFLGVPLAVAPVQGARMPDDRVLRWSADGATPDMYIVSVTGGDGFPAWVQFVPGTLTESPLPDLSSIEGLKDIPAGFLDWIVRGVRIEGFEFNSFHYGHLSPRVWTHTAVDNFTMRL